MLTDSFRANVEDFLTKSGMSPTVFGREAVGDPNFVRDLRAGRSPGLRVADRVSEFIKSRSHEPARAAS